MSWQQGLAPSFSIEVEGTDIGPALSALVKRVEYEDADGLAGLFRLHIANPDFILTRKKLLQPGNEIAIYFGYGENKVFVGRAIIVRPTQNYPSREMPTIDVVGYTRDYQMMNQEPEKGKDRVWGLATIDTVVGAVADRWKLEADVDPTTESLDVLQKAGMSDWELLRGCANIASYVLWIDGDADGKWWLHFKDPAKLEQDVELDLKYNSGPNTLLDYFSPETSIAGGTTKLRVLATDTLKGTVINEEVEADTATADVKFTGDLEEDLPEAPKSREAIKLFFKDYSVAIVPDRGFLNAGEVTTWAKAWFKKHRDDFVTARGRTLIGLPALKARTTHKISGVSEDLDGKWYFSRVMHVFSNEEGYQCDFDCRKVLEGGAG
jgi:phage protein D